MNPRTTTMRFFLPLLLSGATLGATTMTWNAEPLVALRAGALGSFDDDWIPKRSPFRAVEWEGDTPRVLIDDAWYRLVELDGITSERLVTHCKERHGRRWQKRFSEDLVQMLWELGHQPGDTVQLVLVDEHGVRSERAAAPMTEDNRRAVWEHNNPDAGELMVIGSLFDDLRKVDRVSREHGTEVAPGDHDLAQPLQLREWADAPTISRVEAQQDLDQLEWLVRERFSYRDLTGVDVAAVFDAARVGLREQVALPEFELTLRKLLARFGDGHTRVGGSLPKLLPREYTPFLVEAGEGGHVAIRADRSGLLDPDHPWIVALDGEPLDTWLAAAASIEARGAEHSVRRRAQRNLRYLGWLRAELGRERTEQVTVTLRNAAGERVDRELRTTTSKPNFGTWPREAPRVEDGIAYIRIPGMDDDPRFLDDLTRALDAASDARGWVIDVRDNGGGTRDALRVVAPRLLDDATPVLVANVAAYRLAEGDERATAAGYLADRSLFPAGWSGWSEAQRDAVQRAAADFAPEWEPSPAEFSEWHWFAIEAAPADRRFAGEVCVLVDEDCFSATDVFLGALAELPRVTLVGSPSGGGSGRSRGFDLAHSRVSVKLSSMASFRPNGLRYDGRGVEVDVPVLAQPSDFVSTSDAVLDAALERLRAR